MRSDIYFSHVHVTRYVVLAKGFTAFYTDSLADAVNEAEFRAQFSDYVSVLDDGERVAMWSYGHKVQILRR